MISGSFHTLSQEWRYYSREKSLIHTLHLAQLPTPQSGDTVLILPVPTVKNNSKGFSLPPFALPSGPAYGFNATQVTNQSMTIDCYASTNCAGAVLNASRISVQVGPIGGALSQIIMEPQESGFFWVHAECYSAIQQLGNEGPANDGQVTLTILNGGGVASQAVARAKMEGPDWTTHFDWVRRMTATTDCLVPSAGSFKALALNLGNPSDCCLTMFAMKIADYD